MKPPNDRRDSPASPEGETYRAILRELPIAILVLDENGAVFDANAKLSEISGYSHDELMSQTLDALVPEAFVERHRLFCAGFRGSPSTHRMGLDPSYRLRTNAGRTIPVSVVLSGLEEGGRRYVLACVSDTTEFQESLAAKDESERSCLELNQDLEAIVEERTGALTAAHSRIMEQRQLQSDLETAGQVQMSLLPKVFPLVDGFDFASRAKPSRFLSGDIYDYGEAEGGRCSIMLADISGKGLPAAILASSIRSLYRRERRETSSPEALLRNLNREMLPDLELSERFITMIAARLDLESGALEIANAGGCSVIAFDGSDCTSRALELGGIPLGLFPDLGMQAQTIGLRPGMGALICSDGITEAENPRGELFGLDRLLATVARGSRSRPEGIATAIIAAVEEFGEGQPLSDDATLIVLKARPRRIHYKFVTSLESLDEMPASVASACFSYGESLARDMELAVSEALANIREHGYHSREGQVAMDLRLETRGVELSIKEQGKAFDLEAVPPPVLGEAKDGGFGLYLIRKVMDNFSYEPGGADGNLWIFFRSTKGR
jgi:PAS domain S-box-containing protein